MPAAWRLSELGGLDAGPAVVGAVLRTQRSRFLDLVTSLPPERWAAPTRCSAWTVHDVVRHVADVAELDAARLAGRPHRFVAEGGFDPARTPDAWLAGSAAEHPAETVARLVAAVDDELAAFDGRVADASEETAIGATGRTSHWSVVSAHILWDAWLHERDIRLPATYGADELRLVSMYALLCAAVPAAMIGEPLDAVVILDRPYRLSCGDGGIAVTEGDGDGPRVEGSVLVVLDALLGRGPAVADVLTGEVTTLERLAWLRAFMAPGT